MEDDDEIQVLWTNLPLEENQRRRERNYSNPKSILRCPMGLILEILRKVSYPTLGKIRASCSSMDDLVRNYSYSLACKRSAEYVIDLNVRCVKSRNFRPLYAKLVCSQQSLRAHIGYEIVVPSERLAALKCKILNIAADAAVANAKIISKALNSSLPKMVTESLRFDGILLQVAADLLTPGFLNIRWNSLDFNISEAQVEQNVDQFLAHPNILSASAGYIKIYAYKMTVSPEILLKAIIPYTHFYIGKLSKEVIGDVLWSMHGNQEIGERTRIIQLNPNGNHFFDEKRYTGPKYFTVIECEKTNPWILPRSIRIFRTQWKYIVVVETNDPLLNLFFIDRTAPYDFMPLLPEWLFIDCSEGNTVRSSFPPEMNFFMFCQWWYDPNYFFEIDKSFQ